MRKINHKQQMNILKIHSPKKLETLQELGKRKALPEELDNQRIRLETGRQLSLIHI